MWQQVFGLAMKEGREDRSRKLSTPSSWNRLTPFADGLRRGVELPRDARLAQAVIHHGANHKLSTSWGQMGILVRVHSVLRESLGLPTSAFTASTEWTTS
jgi:hypothetical protein